MRMASRVERSGCVAAIGTGYRPTLTQRGQEIRRTRCDRHGATVGHMDIVAAVFIENIELRPAPGPSTRIDLTGVHFSLAAPVAGPGHGGAAPRGARALRPRRRRHRRARDHLPARRRAGRPQRAAAPGRAGQVRLPAGAGRARVRGLRHGGRRGPHRPGPGHTVPFTLLPPARRPPRERPCPTPPPSREHPLPTHATGEVVGQVLETLGEQPDLAVVFVTAAASPEPWRTSRPPFGPRCGPTRSSARPRCRCSPAPGRSRSSRRSPCSPDASRPALRCRWRPRSTRCEAATAGRSVARPTSPCPAPRVVLLADPFSFPVDGVRRPASPTAHPGSGSSVAWRRPATPPGRTDSSPTTW